MANEFKVRKGLVINGSGSALLEAQGSVGQLNTITDSLSGSLFSVNDISGIPVMEAFSDGRVRIGEFGREAIKISGSFATITGSLRGTASQALTASYVTGSVYTITNPALYATTASFLLGAVPTFPFIGAATITGSLTVSSSAGNTLFSSNADTLAITGSALITGSLIITGSVLVSGSITVGGSAINNLTASFAQTASFALNAGGSGFPFIGIANITGSLFISSSNASSSLGLRGSGSGVFTVDGTSGRLFSVDDSLSGSLFSVNTAAGLPVIEAFSDNTVRIGQYNKRALFVSQSVVGINKETALNGVLDISGSVAVTGSLIVSGSINTIGPITGSGFFTAGTITAQTLVVQTITSSVDFVTGSTRFGSLATNTHTFTGSLYVTGAFYVTTGSVGIGTTTPTSGSLQINTPGNNGNNQIALNGGNAFTNTYLGGFAGTTYLTNNYYYFSGHKADDTTKKSMEISFDTEQVMINTMPANSPGTRTRLMHISSSGNVGIGTASPGTALEIRSGTGNTILGLVPNTNTDYALIKYTNVNGTSYIGTDNSTGAVFGKGAYSMNLYNVGTGALVFYTAATERMFISASGNIGIGTAAPLSILDVRAGAGTAGSILNLSNTTGAAAGNIVPIRFYSGNTFGGLEQVAAIYGINPNAGTNNGGALVFATSANGTATTPAERMRITSTGNVGIGTSPDTKLHLYDGTNPLSLKIHRTTVPVYLSDVQTAGTTAGASWSHNVENTSNGSVTWSGFTNTSYAGSAILLNATTADSYINFFTAAAANTNPTNRMTIDGSGNIGAPTGTNIYNASDVRLKKNTTTITDGLLKINALNPVKFNWIDGFVKSEDGKDMLGFVAQEVQNAVPEAVENFGGNSIIVGDTVIENPLRVNEKFIIPVLVKAIQELNQKFEDYKSTHP
jgi:hypothetical protein